jgi:hypothetical protein
MGHTATEPQSQLTPTPTLTEEPHVIPIRLGIYLNPINYSKTPDINLGIWIRFNGTLLAGKEASVDAKGFINSSSPITNFILQMEIFFKLSVVYPIHNDSNGLPAEARLELSKMAPVGPTPLFSVNGPIYITWPNSGDYAPTVGIIFWNYTEIERDVPYVTVHVDPVSENQTELANLINTRLGAENARLTDLLVGFATIDFLLAIAPYWDNLTALFKSEKKTEERNSYQPE